MYILLPAFVVFLQDTFLEIEFQFSSIYTLITLDTPCQASLLVMKLTLSKTQTSYSLVKCHFAMVGQKYLSPNGH